MKRTQLNLALAIAALGLGIGVYFSQEKEEKGPPLTALGVNGVARVAIEHPGSATIRLVKTDKGWELTEPVKARTDDFEVNALLGLADLPTQSTLDRTQLTLKELGLEPPQYSITLNDTVLKFGNIEPLKYQRYIQSGDDVYLVDDPPSAALDKDYSDLVAKSLLPADAEIMKIEAPKLRVYPDTKNAAGLLASWKNAKSMWNESADKNVKGETVTVTLKGRSLKFVIAERDPQLKLHAPELGITYVLSKALENELLTLPEPSKADEKKEEQKS